MCTVAWKGSLSNECFPAVERLTFSVGDPSHRASVDNRHGDRPTLGGSHIGQDSLPIVLLCIDCGFFLIFLTVSLQCRDLESSGRECVYHAQDPFV